MAATITSFETVLTRHSFQFAAYKTQAGMQNPQSNNGSRTIEFAYTYGTTSGQVIDQIITGTVTLAASTTTDYALDTGLSLVNVLGTATPTMTAVKEFWVELLSAAQTDDSGTAGSAASGITVGGAAASWVAGTLTPVATAKCKILNGGKWMHVANTGAGLAVIGGDILHTINLDGAVSAKIRFTFLGVA